MIAKRFLVSLATIGFSALIGVGSASAASLCVPGPFVDEGLGILSVTDVTFRGNNADNCWGVVAGNNTGLPNYFGGGWDQELKDDPPGAPGASTSYAGFNWTLTASGDTVSGTWTLEVADPNGAALPNFPVTLDLMLIPKGGPNHAAYLFTNETFTMDGSNPGTFAITYFNGSGKNFAGLSHLSVYFREGDAPPDDTPTDDTPTDDTPDDVVPHDGDVPVPEPGSLILLGSGLVAAASRFRRQSR